MRDWKSLIVFLLIVVAAAASGSLSAPDAWFSALQKPSFNPPTWLFAPVWSILYAMIAVAGWRVYRVGGIGVALGFWLAQLIVNALWTPLFFGLHRIALALVDIVVLDVLVIATIVLFLRRDRIAGYLLMPYLAWIAFATALTFAIWRLNP